MDSCSTFPRRIARHPRTSVVRFGAVFTVIRAPCHAFPHRAASDAVRVVLYATSYLPHAARLRRFAGSLLHAFAYRRSAR